MRIQFDGSTAFIWPELKQKPGHVGNRKWRKVCKKCNENWIRDIESNAFEILTPLILGQEAKIKAQDQFCIALLACTITCMVDIDDPPTSGISQSERTYIKDTINIPMGWHIFIGRCRSPDWVTRFRHHGFTLARKIDIGGPEQFKVQISTIVMGEIVLHVVSSEGGALGLDGIAYSRMLNLAPIPCDTPLRWADLSVLNSDAIEGIADRIMSDIFKTSGG